jgi:hypothetical protein
MGTPIYGTVKPFTWGLCLGVNMAGLSPGRWNLMPSLGTTVRTLKLGRRHPTDICSRIAHLLGVHRKTPHRRRN